MKISTKGRYALRIMIDIAEHEPQITSVNELAAPARDLRQICRGHRRRAFPRRAARQPPRQNGRLRAFESADAITAGDILRAGEGSLANGRVLVRARQSRPRAAGCKTLPFWRALDRHIAGFCDSVSLSALVTGEFLP